MKNVLILSNSGDLHTDLVVESCQNYNVHCFRFNTDKFRAHGDINLDFYQNSYWIRNIDHYCDLSKIDLFIFRRPEPYYQLDSSISPWLGKLLDQEWSTIENAICYAGNAILLNPINGSALARNKIIQIQAAMKNELPVPELIISNDKDKLLSFAKKYEIITKAIQDSYASHNGSLTSSMTSKISQEQLIDAEESACPTLLQRYVSPKAMWRIVLVGKKVFSFRFTGDALHNNVDSRIIDENLQCEKDNIPIEIEKAFLAMCSSFPINFASSDFIEDQNGKFWFIDLNPDGQWARLQFDTEFSISDEIVKLCIEGAE